jgi:hypothetical protein
VLGYFVQHAVNVFGEELWRILNGAGLVEVVIQSYELLGRFHPRAQ